MDPLFSREANRSFRGALLAAALMVVAVPVALMTWARSPRALGLRGPVEQPVPFDHELHAGADGIDCRYCHWTADRSSWAGVPPSELCMGCHVQILTGSPDLELVRRSVEEGRPIAWRRVHRLPDFVFFEHRAHDRAGVGCETCHGRVDRMTRVEQVAPMTMGWCLDCHRNPEPALRPVEEVTTMGYGEDGIDRKAASGPDGPEAAEPDAPSEPPEGGAGAAAPGIVRGRADVSPGTDCTTCHR